MFYLGSRCKAHAFPKRDRDGHLLSAVVTFVYVAATPVGVVFYGNLVPGDLVYADRTEWPPITLSWVVDYYNYSLLGRLWPEAVLDDNQGPFRSFKMQDGCCCRSLSLFRRMECPSRAQ